MMDKDKIKVKLAISQLQMAKKTLAKYNHPLEDCPQLQSDYVLWGKFHLGVALEYLSKSLEEQDV